MSIICDIMRSKKHFHCMNEITEYEIRQAEEYLHVEFASDYFEYVKECGIASFEGHEFTGFCNSQRLSVVDVTQNERLKADQTAQDRYVVERLGIDDIVIWQDSAGSIYQYQSGHQLRKICNSLIEYIGLED